MDVWPKDRDPRSAAISRMVKSLKKPVAIVVGLVAGLVLLEIGCQVYALYLSHRWSAIKAAPEHYYRVSSSDALVYELASNFSLDQDGRWVRINAHGIREMDDEIPAGRKKIAILGDSVVFGIGLSHEQTLTEVLQQKLDPTAGRVKVLNFGVPGYAFDEILEFLMLKNEIYDVDHVIYLMNPNDFSQRDTIREGADNGLYRMYRLPVLKSPWMIRKAIYRMIKGGKLFSVRYYRWLFKGVRETGFSRIRQMASYLRQRDARFSVVLLPAGCAYNDGTYELDDMYGEICAFLEANDIEYVNPVADFSSDPAPYLDETDHLHYEGNVLMAEIIRDRIVREANRPPA